jgi:NADPH:quinone reductase-like Zn-dependent oxidoreductase
VTSVREGDRVLAFWPGGFATHVVVPAGFVFRAPAALEPVSCATIPIAFGTAWHALHEIAQLRQGESVLVHAGAGGVGLAAIRIAQEAGTEVYATAGSARKREILLEMGVVAAFDSRSAEFEKHLLEATAGQGVDVVLNSLIGELIPAGLRSLRSGGAFIELGKREILSEDELRSVRDDVRYVAFDLRQEAEADASLLPRIAGELCTRFESGRLVPLPATVYPLSEAGSAFRRMARAEHVGKIVLVPHGSAEELADGWCVVTGGTGALGLATVRWLADRGVRRISVLARRGETEEARPVLDSIREGDVEVRVTAVDVSDSRQTELVLDELRATGTPIRGVFHAAGVLDDGTLAQLTPDRLRRVLLPKLAGGWNLHRATLGDPLRAFVLYSAIGPVVDGAGQASYAAANGALDALAAFRRALGLPAVSIIWGPWDGTGMAARLDERRRRHWEELGLGWWSPEDGAGMLDAALATDYPVVIASRLARRAAEPTGVVTEQTKGAQHGLIGRLGALPLHGRLPALQQHVRQCVTSVLGHPEPVDPFRPLREIGLDSLSAIELRNALTVSVGQSLPATLAFDCPTADAIARFLADRIPGFEMHVPAAAAEPAAEDADIVFIESLSEDAAEALLLEELESLREEQRAPAAEPRA